MTDLDGLEILSVGKRKIACLLAEKWRWQVEMRGQGQEDLESVRMTRNLLGLQLK